MMLCILCGATLVAILNMRLGVVTYTMHAVTQASCAMPRCGNIFGQGWKPVAEGCRYILSATICTVPDTVRACTLYTALHTVPRSTLLSCPKTDAHGHQQDSKHKHLADCLKLRLRGEQPDAPIELWTPFGAA